MGAQIDHEVGTVPRHLELHELLLDVFQAPPKGLALLRIFGRQGCGFERVQLVIPAIDAPPRPPVQEGQQDPDERDQEGYQRDQENGRALDEGGEPERQMTLEKRRASIQIAPRILVEREIEMTVRWKLAARGKQIALSMHVTRG